MKPLIIIGLSGVLIVTLASEGFAIRGGGRGGGLGGGGGVYRGPMGGVGVRGPGGGAAYRGPAGGGAVRGPGGAGVAVGAGGGVAARGRSGAGVAVGPGGGAAVRGPDGMSPSGTSTAPVIAVATTGPARWQPVLQRGPQSVPRQQPPIITRRPITPLRAVLPTQRRVPN
jgi:hypothetical protein